MRRTPVDDPPVTNGLRGERVFDLAVAAMTAVAALFSACAAWQSAEAAASSAATAERSLQLEQTALKALADSINPAFLVIEDALQVCTPSSSVLSPRISIEPIFEDDGVQTLGAQKDYDMSTVDSTDPSLVCLTVKSIRKEVCNQYQMDGCAAKLERALITYSVHRIEKVVNVQL